MSITYLIALWSPSCPILLTFSLFSFASFLIFSSLPFFYLPREAASCSAGPRFDYRDRKEYSAEECFRPHAFKKVRSVL